MSGRVRTLFDLIRLPNLFTAAADILAGYLFVGGRLSEWATWLPLAGVSCCLYAGGVALNDVCDAQRDALERRGRPIPSGRISRSGATALVVALLLTGLLGAAAVSLRCGAVAAALVLAIVLYDAVLKALAPAPLLMGACRALNITLGVCGAAAAWEPAHLLPGGLLGLYVVSVTILAKTEASTTSSMRLRVGVGGACVSSAGLVTLAWAVAECHLGYLGLSLLLTLALLRRGMTAIAAPRPSVVQETVKAYVLMIVVFDACIAWAGAGAWAGLAVLTLIVPAVVLSRLFRVT